MNPNQNTINIILKSSDINRFWKFVDKKSQEECWNWRGKVSKGYGRFVLSVEQGLKQVTASRVSWTIHFGEIPKPMLVCHHCDNPKCVNPSHLFLGTDNDNSIDKINKGRFIPNLGSANGNSKLDEQAVKEIKLSQKSPLELAKDYNVHYATIYAILNGETWKHVEA